MEEEDHTTGAPPGGLPCHPQQRAWWSPLFWLGACASLGLSGLIIINTLPYFSFEQDFAFLREKGMVARNPVWSTCFYVHVAGGMLCLVAGPLLIWSGLTRPSWRAHRWLGKAYYFAVLGWAGPTGLYLALYAKGGPAGQIGFGFLGVLWCWTTLLGVRAIRAGLVAEHMCWMLRSYALALSAVLFRLMHVGFYLTGMADDVNYVLSLWLSTFASIGVGEVMILRFVFLDQVGPEQGGVAIRGCS